MKKIVIGYGPRYVTLRQSEYSIEAFMTFKRDDTWDLQISASGIGHRSAEFTIGRATALLQIVGFAQALQASLPPREITSDDAETLGFNEDTCQRILHI